MVFYRRPEMRKVMPRTSPRPITPDTGNPIPVRSPPVRPCCLFDRARSSTDSVDTTRHRQSLRNLSNASPRAPSGPYLRSALLRPGDCSFSKTTPCSAPGRAKRTGLLLSGRTCCFTTVLNNRPAPPPVAHEIDFF